MSIRSSLASKALATLALIALAATTPGAGWAAPEPVTVSVLLPTTGSVALVGQSASTALTILEGIVNKSGGIGGRPLKFVIQDDQSNPAVAVQLASRIISAKEPIMLGSNLSATCSAIAPLVKDGPVDMCFSPGIHPDEGSFVFSPAPSTLDISIVTARYAKKRGWKKMAFIYSTDGSGIDGEKVIN